MNLESMTDLLLHELSDLYSAEQQLLQALPKMAENAFSSELKEAFQTHFEQTKGQVDRLQRAFSIMKAQPERVVCKAMQGLIAEADELLQKKDGADPDVLDAAMIGAAQRVEHYEMAGYGCARTYAHLLGAKQIEKLLQETLDEEGMTNKLLTNLAESTINLDAMETDQEIIRESKMKK